MYSLRNIFFTILAISGFVVGHMTPVRVLLVGASLAFTTFVLPSSTDVSVSVGYFAFTTLFYLVLIYSVLPHKGRRLQWIKQKGEEQAFRGFEGWLAFAFFHNAAGLTHLSQCTANTGFWGDVPLAVLLVLSGTLFLVGLGTKIWSALVVGVPIYYWKDMFLGRPVGEFVVSGPYKYLNNPMYGIGQLQVYGIALYYNSSYGLISAVVNQLLVFSFYYLVERPFIERVYSTGAVPEVALS
jgi:protein-S-isoprenylcysteine O-methyltransferase Ste14